MEIKKAVFVISNTELEKCPKPTLPELAFIGRSNVGKSSLINMLANKKDLAKVSGTPGKTQLINHFLMNDSMYWVDLPGYGFAKVAQKKRAEWTKMIWNYIEKRENLLCLFVLLDSRHAPQEIDIEFINKLGEKGVPFTLIYTKTDKNTQKEVALNINAMKEALAEKWEEMPDILLTSATKRSGRDRVLNYIAQVAQRFYADKK